MLTMATIHVDGKEYEVNGADNLLEACLNLGLDIPYFCWHQRWEALALAASVRLSSIKMLRIPAVAW